jgi:Kef-type K+ transport system membrane component KefB
MDLDTWAAVVVWPLMLLAAWLAGEWAAQHARIPRVCAYGLVGLALSGLGLTQSLASPSDLNRDSQTALAWMANMALALTLFELGYRINPRWFLRNPWVLVAGLTQAALTFAAVMWVGHLFALPTNHSLVLAALCVATSPAAVMRITHELRSAGQVTERLLHLCALNCLLAVLLFKCVVGYWHLETSGDWGKAAFNSVYVIGLSLVVGAVFGVIAPVLNRLASTPQNSVQATTVTFALCVLLLTGLAQTLQLSPLLAALAFGAVARERRVMLSHAQRNFGALGDVLTVFLFVFIGSLLSWEGLLSSLLLGAVVLTVRSSVHVLVNAGVARISGTTFRKGALTGLSLMPMSAFALLLLEESRRYGFDLGRESLPVIVGLLVMQDVIGPWVTQRALLWAGEAQPTTASLATPEKGA